MRLFLRLGILLALGLPVFGDVIGFYSGDFDPAALLANGLANETDAVVSGSPTGASTYQAFVVPTGGWTVTRLFSNNIMGFTPTSAYWELRSGVTDGNGGTLLYSGTSAAPSFVGTGRAGFGYNESTVTVSGLSIALAPGTYWMAVTPQDLAANARAYHTNTFGANAIGVVPQNVAYLNSSSFGADFSNANNFGTFPALSSGVYIAGVPEPAEISLLLLSTGGLLGIARRRRHS